MGGRRCRCPFLVLVYLFLALLSNVGLGLAQILNVTLSADLVKLRAEEHKTIHVQVVVPKSQWSHDRRVEVVPKVQDPAVARVRDYTHTFLLNTGETEDSDGETAVLNGTLTVDGLFLGKTNVFFQFALIPNSTQTSQPKILPSGTAKNYTTHVESLFVVVTRSRWAVTLNAIFLSTLGCLIILANIGMGCQLQLQVVLDVVKRPIAPIIGFCCQFLVMPLIAFGLAKTVMCPAGLFTLALGVFTAGCAPGGGASNFWTVLLNGNADLSITMTFISTVAALGMMPMWMWLLGVEFLGQDRESQIHIPYKHIFTSLVVLVVPLFFGVLIKRFRNKCAEKITKVLRPFLIFILVFIVSFGTYANLYMFKLITWRVLVCGLALPWTGFMCGCFAAILLGQPPANVAAIAIETGVQNAGVAIMLLKFSFPEPDGDLASVLPVVVSIFTPFPLMLGASVHKVLGYFEQKKRALEEAGEAKEPLEAVPLQEPDMIA